MARQHRTYECWPCGATFTTPREHMTHATNCPRLHDPNAMKRPVSCPACATDIDIRKTTECPRCHRHYDTDPQPTTPNTRITP